jgi:hypothetical protein
MVKRNRLSVVLILVLLVPLTALGDAGTTDFQWTKLEAAGRILGGRVVTDEDPEAGLLLVYTTSPASRPTTVLIVENPPITQPYYAVTGKLRYENVRETGYLEMWSHFPDGQAFFSRTLSVSGPGAKLIGSSDWREFQLPFFAKPDYLPRKIELNVVLPGGGRVWLGPVKLVQTDDASKLGAMTGNPYAWWLGPRIGQIGSILGSAVGVLGALIGVLGGLGLARPLVMGLMGLMIVSGALFMLAGFGALALSLPYIVYYPLLVIGGLELALGIGLLPGLRRRYEQAELRKMQAADIV